MGIQGRADTNLHSSLMAVRSSHMFSVTESLRCKVTNGKEKDRRRCVSLKLVRELELVMSLHKQVPH